MTLLVQKGDWRGVNLGTLGGVDIGGRQNDGPFSHPYYSTAPNI